MHRNLPILLVTATALCVLAADPAFAAVGAPGQKTPLASASPLEVVVLGSGGPGAVGRAASSYLVLLDGVPRILVDAGPGSFARLGETGLSLARVDTVLLTHLHADHAGELPGLFKARAVSSGGPIRFSIFGPAGTRAHGGAAAFPSTSRFIELLFGQRGAFAYLRDFAAPITFRVTDLPVRGRGMTAPAEIVSGGDLIVRAIAGHHGDAPAVIYRIDYSGRSVTFSGDIDAKGLPALEKLAAHTGLLVFNAVVLDPPGSPEILYSLHTPPDSIGALAHRAGAWALLLSHLSPAVDGDRSAVAASIARNYQGPVSFAADGLRMSPLGVQPEGAGR